MTAELIAPMIRNFIPASLDLELAWNAARATIGRVVNSREMYMVTNSDALASSTIPVAENKTSP